MSEQKTLRDYAIAKYGTIKQFAKVWGQSASTVSGILRGTHHCTCTRDDIQRMANLFDISFEECVKTSDFTFRTNHPQHLQDGYWDLETRWAREARIEQEFTEWAQNGYQGQNPFTFDPFAHEALATFGLSRYATKADVLNAFREKAKAAHQHGNFNIDMDDLVQAKEKALKYVTSRSR